MSEVRVRFGGPRIDTRIDTPETDDGSPVGTQLVRHYLSRIVVCSHREKSRMAQYGAIPVRGKVRQATVAAAK